MIERTLILVKHDGVLRGIVGEIIRRFENIGLKIVGLKMIWADQNIAQNHYLVTDEWANAVFDKTKKSFENQGKKFPFSNPKEYGAYIQQMNTDFLKEGPVVAIVLQGAHATELGRKIVGNTEPRQALPGTIRGDFMHDSYSFANHKERSVRNLVHASGTAEEASREIPLWFSDKELYSYKKELDKHHF